MPDPRGVPRKLILEEDPLPGEEGRTACNATAKSSGKSCKFRVKPGFTVCHYHGGPAPQVTAKANIRQREAEARQRLKKQLAERGASTIEDAVSELDKIAAEAVTFKEICREQLDRLHEQWRYEHQHGEQLRSEVAVYERALDRCDRILTNYVRLGIAEKKVRISEIQAEMLVGAIRAILTGLNLNQYQQSLAVTLVPQALRAIAAPGQEEEDPEVGTA